MITGPQLTARSPEAKTTTASSPHSDPQLSGRAPLIRILKTKNPAQGRVLHQGELRKY